MTKVAVVVLVVAAGVTLRVTWEKIPDAEAQGYI